MAKPVETTKPNVVVLKPHLELAKERLAEAGFVPKKETIIDETKVRLHFGVMPWAEMGRLMKAIPDEALAHRAAWASSLAAEILAGVSKADRKQ